MKRGLSYTLIFLPLLVGIVFLVLPLNRNRNAAISAQNSGATATGVEPNKLIFTLQYISTDYGKAVQNRKVVNTSELQEMKDFSKAVLGWYQKLKPDFVHDDAYSNLRKLDDLINARAEGTEVGILTGSLIQQLSKEFNVIPFPTEEPQLAQGKALFGSVCAVCHGISGDGLGPKAKELTPPPSAFQDPVQMNKVSPYQLFNAITYGVAGTAMPSHGQALTPIQRWDVAFYLLTLRKGFSPKSPAKKLKISIRDLAISSNEDLVHRLRTESESGLWADSGNAADAKWLAVVDYLRQNPPRVNPKEHLYYARQKINQSLHSYRQGHTEAAIELSLDAYLRGIEPLEPALRQKSPALVSTLEQEFTAYRGALKSHRTLAEAEHQKQTLLTLFDDVKSTLQPSEAAWSMDFVQSLTIILREGVEAALLIAIMITYLVAAGYSHLKKFVTAGALTGIVVGGVTWLAAQIFLSITQLHQEALEGITSLLAATVLFSVSFWIIHNIDIQRWKNYIRSKAETALDKKSGLALALTAFLAVYREAFETVLFYQAMWLRSYAQHSSIVVGFVLGFIALTLLIVLIFKFGLKIPLKPFFGITGVLLSLLAFSFAGSGVRELQNIGWLRESFLPWKFNWNLLEIHSTYEGLTLQLGILMSFVSGWLVLYFQRIKAQKVR